MYQTIIIECQTKDGNISCEDCIAYKTCNLQKKATNSQEEKQAELIQFAMQCY